MRAQLHVSRNRIWPTPAKCFIGLSELSMSTTSSPASSLLLAMPTAVRFVRSAADMLRPYCGNTVATLVGAVAVALARTLWSDRPEPVRAVPRCNCAIRGRSHHISQNAQAISEALVARIVDSNETHAVALAERDRIFVLPSPLRLPQRSRLSGPHFRIAGVPAVALNFAEKFTALVLPALRSPRPCDAHRAAPVAA